MIKYFHFIAIACLVAIGCTNKIKEDQVIYDPHKVGSISFPLDSLTSFNNHFQIVKKGSKSFLYMLTAYNNRFVVYDIQTQRMVNSFEIKSDERNPISVGGIPPSGFNYINPDSILLYDFKSQKIFLGNEKGEKSLIIDLRKKFPSERGFWGASFQGAEPYIINDSILSITGAVVAGETPFKENETSDLFINLISKEVTKTVGLPSSYISGNYYPTTRLRPSRAFDKQRGVFYYSFQNSDSIQMIDFKAQTRTAFFASHIDKTPTIETNNFDEFRSFEKGVGNQLVYNKSQGTFTAIHYNPNRDQIIRIGAPGVKGLTLEEYKNRQYKDEKIISFYDAETHKLLGNIKIEGLGYDFMFFDENNFFMAEISNNKSEDELTFTKFKYPDF